MLESLKNALLASLGMLAITQEKLQAGIDDLIERGELTREQGKKLLGELLAKGQAESQALSGKISGEMSRVMEKTPFVTRREYRRLQERVRALEERLGAVAPDEVEPSSSASEAPLEAPGGAALER